MKIALIGSAPSSVKRAPYDDKSWKVIGCSPGAAPFVKRADAWVEIHRFEPPDGPNPQPWFQPDYIEYMRRIQGPVYMIEPVKEIPNSVAYPMHEMLDEFGPYFSTNSLSWMVMLAVKAGATEIGLWGVDMAAQTEWVFQRTGLQCLLWFISDRNKHSPFKVKVTLPPESDLWVPPVLYGFSEANPHYTKLQARREELQARKAQAQTNLENSKTELLFLTGACDDHEYHIGTWVTDRKAREMAFGGHAYPASVPATPPKVSIDDLLEADGSPKTPDPLGDALVAAEVANAQANGHLAEAQ